MQRAEDYRRKAQECLSECEHAKDPNVKLSWQELAKSWFLLAEQADKSLPNKPGKQGPD